MRRRPGAAAPGRRRGALRRPGPARARELRRAHADVGLGLAALAPPLLRELAGELLGHPPRADDLERLRGELDGRVRDLLPGLPPPVLDTLLTRICRMPPPRRAPGSQPHAADSAVTAGVADRGAAGPPRPGPARRRRENRRGRRTGASLAAGRPAASGRAATGWDRATGRGPDRRRGAAAGQRGAHAPGLPPARMGRAAPGGLPPRSGSPWRDAPRAGAPMADRRGQLASRVRDSSPRRWAPPVPGCPRAQAELTAGRERLARVQRAAAAVPERVGAQRDRRLAEIDDPLLARDRRSWPGGRPTRPRQEAPGARVGRLGGVARRRPARRAEPPGALRVGTVRIDGVDPVPALVPLLDPGTSVSAATTRRRDDGGRRRCCCARSARADPGAVRLIGYDPEHLGGGLAGFAPLARPACSPSSARAGWPRCWTSWWITSAGSTRRCWPASTRRCASWPPPPAAGPSRGGWRCCWAARDELNRHERGQLDRLVRTGAACGVHLVIRGLPVPAAAGDSGGAPRRRATRPGSAAPAACRSGWTRRPPAALVTETCREIADAGERRPGAGRPGRACCRREQSGGRTPPTG